MASCGEFVARMIPRATTFSTDDRERLGADAFAEIASANRETYALYEIAQSMGRSMSLTETMTLVSAKLSELVPFSTCALFVRRGDDGFALQILHRSARRPVGECVDRGGQRIEWVGGAPSPAACQRAAQRGVQRGGSIRSRLTAAVRPGLPVDCRGRGDRHDRRLSSGPRIVHGRPPPRARSGGPSGSVSRTQCARIRAHPGTGIQRWPDRTRQPARAAVSGLHESWGAPAGPPLSSRSFCWISTTSRSSTTSMGTSPAIVRCRRSPGCCSRRRGRTIRASGTEATNSSSCFRRAAAPKPRSAAACCRKPLRPSPCRRRMAAKYHCA